MSTVKELIQSFCDRQNVPKPAAFVSVNSPTEAYYLELLRYIGDTLRNKPYNFPQLKASYLFNSQTDVSRYPLPGDFYRILRNTEWDTQRFYGLNGPVSDSRFAQNVYGVADLADFRVFRIVGPTAHLIATTPWSKRASGVFEIDRPGLNNTDEFYLGYISCNWIWPKDWVTGTNYPANSLVSGDGHIYFSAAGGTAGATRPSHASGSASDGTVIWTVYHEPFPCAPSNTQLSDTSIVLFDDDTVIEGMMWRHAELKKMEGAQSLKNDWENQVKNSYGRFNGPVKITMGGPDLGAWYRVPDGSWPVGN